MVRFTSIRKSEHYRRHHEKELPWHEVVELILTTKSPRKKGDRIEIETKGAYLLCTIKGDALVVINAKRRGR